MFRSFLSALFSVFILSLAASAVHTPAFVEPTYFDFANDFPDSSGVADLNGDGKLDIVIGNNSSTQILVLLNKGAGNFSSATYSVGSPNGDSPSHIVLCDLNHDGKMDVVTSDRFNVISVLLNNGDGTFGAAKTYPGAPVVGGLVAGDFNEDGNPDVVVTAATGGDILVYLGNGDGTLQTAVSYASVAGAEDVAAADLNRDGHLDLVLVGTTIHGIDLYGVMLGNGDGTFQKASTIDTITEAELALVT